VARPVGSPDSRKGSTEPAANGLPSNARNGGANPVFEMDSFRMHNPLLAGGTVFKTVLPRRCRVSAIRLSDCAAPGQDGSGGIGPAQPVPVATVRLWGFPANGLLRPKGIRQTSPAPGAGPVERQRPSRACRAGRSDALRVGVIA